MLDNIKDTLIGGARDLGAAAGEKLGSLDFEKLIPDQVFNSWHAFTHRLFIILIVGIVVLVLFNTVLDKVRRVIRGLDVAAIGGVLYWLGSRIPDVILIRELIKPLHKIGLILMGVGVALFIVIKLVEHLASKGAKAVTGKSGDDAEKASAGPSAAGRLIAMILAVAVGAGAGVAADRWIISSNEAKKLDSATVEETLVEIAEMAAYECDYTESIEYKGDPKKLFGHDVPFTSKSMELQFSGSIKAGVEMDKAKINVDKSAGTIDVTLPHSRILSHEINEDSIKILSIKNGVFNRVSLENNNEARKLGKRSKEKKILKTDFLKQADDKVVKQMTELLQAAYPNAKVSVHF